MAEVYTSIICQVGPLGEHEAHYDIVSTTDDERRAFALAPGPHTKLYDDSGRRKVENWIGTTLLRKHDLEDPTEDIMHLIHSIALSYARAALPEESADEAVVTMHPVKVIYEKPKPTPVYK